MKMRDAAVTVNIVYRQTGEFWKQRKESVEAVGFPDALYLEESQTRVFFLRWIWKLVLRVGRCQRWKCRSVSQQSAESIHFTEFVEPASLQLL